MEISQSSIKRLLKPDSVAIVGASPKPASLGASVLANLQRTSFAGELHLINPNYAQIGDLVCRPSVADLPLGVDVAVLAIPRSGVIPTLEALAQRQAAAVIIFSAGFAEAGEQGKLEQQRIAEIATEHSMVVEGPNCLGLVNYVDEIALTFVETPASPLGNRRGIGILSQSGAMAAVLGVTLIRRDLGVSYSISTGNEAASGIEDYVAFLLEDQHTQVAGLIVEQFRQPQRFLQLARQARVLGKLLVLLHPGKSVAAREAAATHTGAMAGDYELMRVQVERAGVLVVNSLEELGDVLELAVRSSQLPKPGTAVITESGAYKALTLDLSEQIDLVLPEITETTSPDLRQVVPDFVSLSNPLDLTAQGLVEPDLYQRAIQTVLADQRFGSLVLGVIQTDKKTASIKFPRIIEAVKLFSADKTVIFAGLDEGAEVPVTYIQELREAGVTYFPSPERAFRALCQLTNFADRDFKTAETRLENNRLELPESAGVVPEYLCKVLLASRQIPFPAGRLAIDLDEALIVAEEIGYPVVLKVQSAGLSHKSDAGGVALSIADAQALADTWRQISSQMEVYAPGLTLDGILVEAMGERGVELIIGGRQDPDWGAVVLIGFGGVHAEILKDVRLLAADLTAGAIIEELKQLRSAPLLLGFRGSVRADLVAVADLVTKVGALLLQESRIQEIDLNPVMVHAEGSGLTVLDALMQIGD